jgi:4-alpha-glucanotransferase
MLGAVRARPSAGEIRALHRLAQAHGVQTSYTDGTGSRRVAHPAALLAVLQALGAPVRGLADVPEALRARRRESLRRLVEPVLPLWQGRPARLRLHLPARQLTRRLRVTTRLEDGQSRTVLVRAADLTLVGTLGSEGERFVAVALPPGGPWPTGYHRLSVEIGGRVEESLVVVAPRRAWSAGDRRAWGAFCPVHALRSGRGWGTGDFTDLETLADWIHELGGEIVATLPVLAAFLDEPCEPSPYAPASRLFWNELFLDVETVPELARCAPARSILGSAGFRHELARLCARGEVDHRGQLALKRRVLEPCARQLFAERTSRREELARFAERHADAERYARFRAAVERHGPPSLWRERMRRGHLRPGDPAEDAFRYHLYVQWLAEQQLGSLAQRLRSRGQTLYLDLPLGVHREGYDVWRHPEAFARSAAAGAPPDALFSRGQNWSFPPLHPERTRASGHRYLIACLRHHLRVAGMLRLDHVMGLHRLFWVPEGFEAIDGVYVRYPAQELYAVLSLESHRHGGLLVGEDLGTVPAAVRASMDRHGVRRLHVLQLACEPRSRRRVLRPAPPAAVASLNTHDLAPFAAFWRGADIRDRVALGLIGPAQARADLAARRRLVSALFDELRRGGWVRGGAPTLSAALAGCLRSLAAGPAGALVVGLEDLWLETRPQNVPGTTVERPNWRRKMRSTVEATRGSKRLRRLLHEIDRIRRR